MQIRNRNTAALEFINHIQQLGQKFGLALNRSVKLKLTVQISCRGGHSYDSAALIHAGNRSGARSFGNAIRKAGKGQHLGKTTGSIACRHTKPSLDIMADQLRDHEDPPRTFCLDIICNTAQYLICSRKLIATQQQFQHEYFTSLFLYSIIFLSQNIVDSKKIPPMRPWAENTQIGFAI
jgi:hypothetical protein